MIKLMRLKRRESRIKSKSLNIVSEQHTKTEILDDIFNQFKKLKGAQMEGKSFTDQNFNSLWLNPEILVAQEKYLNGTK